MQAAGKANSNPFRRGAIATGRPDIRCERDSDCGDFLPPLRVSACVLVSDPSI
jgi:hypothetical protein